MIRGIILSTWKFKTYFLVLQLIFQKNVIRGLVSGPLAHFVYGYFFILKFIFWKGENKMGIHLYVSVLWLHQDIQELNVD